MRNKKTDLVQLALFNFKKLKNTYKERKGVIIRKRTRLPRKLKKQFKKNLPLDHLYKSTVQNIGMSWYGLIHKINVYDEFPNIYIEGIDKDIPVTAKRKKKNN